MSYTLTLTPDDVSTIQFVGHRYGWSDALSGCGVGSNAFEEHEAWEIRDAMEADTEGGHSYFPMLDHSSDLAAKLYQFIEEIV